MTPEEIVQVQKIARQEIATAFRLLADETDTNSGDVLSFNLVDAADHLDPPPEPHVPLAAMKAKPKASRERARAREKVK